MRRQTVVAGALALLLATSGCLGFVAGSKALSFEATAADTTHAAASNAGYQKNGTRAQTINRTLEVAGQERTVRVENKVTTYEKTVTYPILGEQKLGVFSIISTPAVEIAGRTMNPIADFDNQRLLRLIATRYETLEVDTRVGTHNVTVHGTETTVSKYRGTATVQGQSIDVYVHVTKVKAGEDYLVLLGVYPRQLDDEGAKLRRMMRQARHPA